MSNHEHDTATGEGMPPAKEHETKAQSADEETVFVKPEGFPFWQTALHLPQEDGATLVIDASGSHVPKAQLDSLREQAARSGVTLSTEVSD